MREVKVTQVDVSSAFAFACAAKDEAEVSTVKVRCSVPRFGDVVTGLVGLCVCVCVCC